MKLFAVYVGGDLAGANIELHDMRFVVAPSIAETYPELRRQWWGIPKSLHIACWAEIDHADGYDVSLRAEPSAGPQSFSTSIWAVTIRPNFWRSTRMSLSSRKRLPRRKRAR